MLLYPQLATGALVQYPIRKRRSERTILNISEDGWAIALSDPYASEVRWDLAYEGLTDQEVANVTSFFELCEGPLQPFLFLDPTENLFAYSEDYSQPAWQLNSLITVTTGIDDPLGTTRASRLVNTSAGTLEITQTVPIPGSVTCAFSVYLRAVSGGTGFQMTGTDGSTVNAQQVAPNTGWTRFSLTTGFASSTSTECDFSVSMPSGTTLDVFAMQLDPQPAPGTYVSSTSETGVYPNCRFNSNQITVVGTGPNQSSIQLSIISKASQ